MARTRMLAVDHPGTVIKAELTARGWTQRDLAYVLGTTEQQLNRTLSGKSSVTPDMACALADAFDVSADFFANLQKQYDLSRAKEPDPDVKKRAAIQSSYPLREMIKRGWIDDTDASLLELQIARFFETDTISSAPRMAHAGRKSHYDSIPPAQLAWLFRVRQIAKTLQVGTYSEEGLRRAVEELRSMVVEPDEIRRVPEILAACGVRFVIVEALPNAKIDGVCFWLDDQPVIGMTLRFDRLDNFWFVLLHEIEHILRGHGKEAEILDDLDGENSGTGQNISEQERQANEAASNFCVPRQKMLSFYQRKNPYFSEKDVLGFAAVQTTHPALVVGQLQHLTGKFHIFRKYLIPVRKHLVEQPNPLGAIDGWGRVAPMVL